MQSVSPRRRHAERAHAKRTPQISVVDTDPSNNAPAPVSGLPLSGPVTLTIVTGPTGAAKPPPPAASPTFSTPAAIVPSIAAAPTPTQIISVPPNDGAPSIKSASGAAKSSGGGIPAGSVAGLVIGLLVLIGGITFFFLRKRFMSMRERKRTRWSDAVFSNRQEGEKQVTSPPQFAFMTPSSIPAPPTMSYNNPSAPTGPTSARKPVPTGTTATVRCTFIPNLPDELSITTGESIRILSEYDDGWALCSNSRGEQGMVPVECLEKGSQATGLAHVPTDWRNAQRASSLVSPGRPGY